MCAGAAWSADFVRDGSRVVCGDARFDVLSPTLVRMQHAHGGFVDAPTAVVLNRAMGDKEFKAESRDGWLEIKTSRMAIRYLIGSGKLTSDNLRVVWKDGRGEHQWKPGQPDEGNLGGPISSFNAILEETKPENTLPDFPPGPLSRSGYHLLDDSRTPVWDEKAEWIAPRADKEAQDWYFLVYGTDFAGMFREYTELCGRIPMIPRYALGAWVTDLNFEYFNQNVDQEYLESLVARFRKEGIPLDILVLDFGWHLFGWRGGLDWSPIIPDPKAFLKKMRDKGIRVTLNDHPGSGLFMLDSHVESVRKELNLSLPSVAEWEDISKDWLFRTDPDKRGQDEGWFSTDHNESDWHKMPEATTWENAGFAGYDGIGWYRKWVEIPERFRGKPVHITFGGVDDEYDLYANGSFVVHYGAPGQSYYERLSSTDITSHVRPGERNLICLRVLDWGHYGGITRWPVAISNEAVKLSSVYFNLANKREAEVYMALHNAIIDQGVDFWWIDGDSAWMDGLNSQMWTNHVYYDSQEKHTGKRSFIFSRYGGPGSHRYPAFFTGDCYSNWKVLAYEIPYTLKAGNALIPYVTHDIGGFIGTLKDDFELYARWVQFGALSPILRLHSAHENPDEGNARLPWNYGRRGIELAGKFFRLRYSLIPYLYTYCRAAFDTGLPLARPLYLEYPDLEAAYEHFDEYLLGREMLVAPITSPGRNGVAARDVYLPPGKWTDYFTGRRYDGARTIRYECPLDRMPIFVRDGAIIPMQPDMAFTAQAPLDPLILDVYAGKPAAFDLYEDDGLSLDYRRGKCAWTPIRLERDGAAAWRIRIGPARGAFKGQVAVRRHVIKLHCARKPQHVTADGSKLEEKPSAWPGWEWDPTRNQATIRLKAVPVRRAVEVRYAL